MNYIKFIQLGTQDNPKNNYPINGVNEYEATLQETLKLNPGSIIFTSYKKSSSGPVKNEIYANGQKYSSSDGSTACYFGSINVGSDGQIPNFSANHSGEVPEIGDIYIYNPGGGSSTEENIAECVAYYYSNNKWQAFTGNAKADKVIFTQNIDLAGNDNQVENPKVTDNELQSQGKTLPQVLTDILYYVDSSIKNLGPVFSFKGVGTYIDPDQTTITLGSGHISGTVGVLDNPIFGCYGTQYGSTDGGKTFTMMYGWGNSAELFFWTKEMITSDNHINIIQYTRSDEESKSNEYIEIGEDRYFAAMRNDEIKSIIWKNTSGDTLYTYPNDTDSSKVDVYATSSKSNPLAVGIDVKTFNYYNFTKIPTQYTLVLDTDIKIETASKDNNGDVYQIEEEEYASNGNMWVQLGSPKNKWIVL